MNHYDYKLNLQKISLRWKKKESCDDIKDNCLTYNLKSIFLYLLHIWGSRYSHLLATYSSTGIQVLTKVHTHDKVLSLSGNIPYWSVLTAPFAATHWEGLGGTSIMLQNYKTFLSQKHLHVNSTANRRCFFHCQATTSPGVSSLLVTDIWAACVYKSVAKVALHSVALLLGTYSKRLLGLPHSRLRRSSGWRTIIYIIHCLVIYNTYIQNW